MFLVSRIVRTRSSEWAECRNWLYILHNRNLGSQSKLENSKLDLIRLGSDRPVERNDTGATWAN